MKNRNSCTECVTFRRLCKHKYTWRGGRCQLCMLQCLTSSSPLVYQSDVGGQRTLQRRWTTFAKAQLLCQADNELPYNVIQDIDTLPPADGAPADHTLFYGIFTSQWSVSKKKKGSWHEWNTVPTTSSVCVGVCTCLIDKTGCIFILPWPHRPHSFFSTRGWDINCCVVSHLWDFVYSSHS